MLLAADHEDMLLSSRLATRMNLMPLPISRPAVFLFLSFGVIAQASSATDGRAVYDKTCAACHATGVANAPRFGDKAAWAPRVAGGMPVLVRSVLKGKGAMPAKAGNPKLKSEEIRAAVEFMVAAAQ